MSQQPGKRDTYRYPLPPARRRLHRLLHLFRMLFPDA